MKNKYQDFNEFIHSLPDGERQEIAQYCDKHDIKGNPILEQLLMREYQAGKVVTELKNGVGGYIEDFKNQLTSLAKTYQEQIGNTNKAQVEIVSKFTETLVNKLNEVVAIGHRQLGESVAAHQRALDKYLEQKMTDVEESFKAERNTVLKGFMNIVKGELKPVVREAFKAQTNRFTLQVTLRDIAIVLASLGIWNLVALMLK